MKKNQILISSMINESDAILKLIVLFINEFPTRLNEIKALYSESDWENLTKRVHALKGTAGNFGFLDVTEVAKSLEEVIQDKQYNNVEVALNQLDDLEQRISAGIDSYNK